MVLKHLKHITQNCKHLHYTYSHWKQFSKICWPFLSSVNNYLFHLVFKISIQIVIFVDSVTLCKDEYSMQNILPSSKCIPFENINLIGST